MSDTGALTDVIMYSGVPERTGECFIYVIYIINRERSAYGDVRVGRKNSVAHVPYKAGSYRVFLGKLDT